MFYTSVTTLTSTTLNSRNKLKKNNNNIIFTEKSLFDYNWRRLVQLQQLTNERLRLRPQLPNNWWPPKPQVLRHLHPYLCFTPHHLPKLYHSRCPNHPNTCHHTGKLLRSGRVVRSWTGLWTRTRSCAPTTLETHLLPWTTSHLFVFYLIAGAQRTTNASYNGHTSFLLMCPHRALDIHSLTPTNHSLLPGRTDHSRARWTLFAPNSQPTPRLLSCAVTLLFTPLSIGDFYIQLPQGVRDHTLKGSIGNLGCRSYTPTVTADPLHVTLFYDKNHNIQYNINFKKLWVLTLTYHPNTSTYTP